MLAVTLKTFQIQCMKSFLLTAHYLIKIKSSIASSKNFEIIQLLICDISNFTYVMAYGTIKIMLFKHNSINSLSSKNVFV